MLATALAIGIATVTGTAIVIATATVTVGRDRKQWKIAQSRKLVKRPSDARHQSHTPIHYPIRATKLITSGVETRHDVVCFLACGDFDP
jgi:hypothetical protein